MTDSCLDAIRKPTEDDKLKLKTFINFCKESNYWPFYHGERVVTPIVKNTYWRKIYILLILELTDV